METVPLLDELAIIAALAVAVTVILARFKLPTVAGLLAAGALLGPTGLGLVRSMHAIEVLAEVGVVLLLFTIGLEFSLERLRHIFRQAAVGGALQVGLTTAVTTGIAVAFGEPIGHGIFYGFVFALSSTPFMPSAADCSTMKPARAALSGLRKKASRPLPVSSTTSSASASRCTVASSACSMASSSASVFLRSAAE